MVTRLTVIKVSLTGYVAPGPQDVEKSGKEGNAC